MVGACMGVINTLLPFDHTAHFLLLQPLDPTLVLVHSAQSPFLLLCGPQLSGRGLTQSLVWVGAYQVAVLCCAVLCCAVLCCVDKNLGVFVRVHECAHMCTLWQRRNQFM